MGVSVKLGLGKGGLTRANEVGQGSWAEGLVGLGELRGLGWGRL